MTKRKRKHKRRRKKISPEQWLKMSVNERLAILPFDEEEFWEFIVQLPLSKNWQKRLDRLFDKIDNFFGDKADEQSHESATV
jgi:hypothetical protein